MIAKEAYALVESFSKGRFKPEKCRETRNYYFFYQESDSISAPLYVEKNTGKVGAYNPLSSGISPSEFEKERYVMFR